MHTDPYFSWSGFNVEFIGAVHNFATSRLRVRVHNFPSCLMMARKSVLSAVRRSITARRRRWRGWRGWIAEGLAMGTRGYLNPLLYRRRTLGGE